MPEGLEVFLWEKMHFMYHFFFLFLCEVKLFAEFSEER